MKQIVALGENNPPKTKTNLVFGCGAVIVKPKEINASFTIDSEELRIPDYYAPAVKQISKQERRHQNQEMAKEYAEAMGTKPEHVSAILAAGIRKLQKKKGKKRRR